LPGISVLHLQSGHRQAAPACPYRANIKTHALQQTASQFDHLVGGGEQRLREAEPAMDACLQIVYQASEWPENHFS
jgi:hypothetical protein